MDTLASPRPASAPPRTADTVAASSLSPSPSSTFSAKTFTKNSKSSISPAAAAPGDSTTSSSPSGSRKAKSSGTPKGSSSPLRSSRPQEQQQGDRASSTALSDSSSATASVGLGVSASTTNDTSKDGQEARPKGPPANSTNNTPSTNASSPRHSSRKDKQQASASEPATMAAAAAAAAAAPSVARETGSGGEKPTSNQGNAAGTNENSDTPRPATSAKGASEEAESESESKKSQRTTSARSPKAPVKPRKGQQQQGTMAGPNEQKADGTGDLVSASQETVNTAPLPSSSTLAGHNETVGPFIDDSSEGTAGKKRKDKRRPKKGGLAPGGEDNGDASSTKTETTTQSEVPDTRLASSTKPSTESTLATTLSATASATKGDQAGIGKATSDAPTKKNATALTGGDVSDGSEAQRTVSPRPGKGGGGSKTKSPKPVRERPDRSPLRPPLTADESGAIESANGQATAAATDRRPTRAPRPAKETKIAKDTSSVSESASASTNNGVTTEDASSSITSQLNGPSARAERGPRPPRQKADVAALASAPEEKKEQKEPALSKGKHEAKPSEETRKDESQQQRGPSAGASSGGASRGRYSERGGGRSARGGLSRVFTNKEGQSSLDARVARQEANRRERELRQQQQENKPEVSAKNAETAEETSKKSARGRNEATAKSAKSEPGSKQSSATEPPFKGGSIGVGSPEKGGRTSSPSPSRAEKKESGPFGSWKEVKAPGAPHFARLGSAAAAARPSRPDRSEHTDRTERGERHERPERHDRQGRADRPERYERHERPERGEGFSTGYHPRKKDVYFANSMICYMTWDEMKLRQDVIECIHRYGLKHPSNVQKLALVPFGEGRDIIAQAQSQNDRTNTFAIGVLQKLDKNNKRCQAAVICSDRVQPQQVFKDLERWFDGTGINCVMLNETTDEELKKRESTHVVVTTLGRLTEVIESRLLSMGTVDTVGICMAQHELIEFESFKKLWAKLSRKAQVVLLTGNLHPRLRQVKVQNFRSSTVVLRADELTLKWSQHFVIRLDSPDQKWQALVDIFDKNKTITHTVVVTLSNRMTQWLVSKLKERGIPAHGIWSMADKVEMAELFNKPDDCVLVVESALTNELDLDHDSLVINYEMPWMSAHYMQTFGLFGRSGLRTMMINMLLTDKPAECSMVEELEAVYDIKIAEMKLA